MGDLEHYEVDVLPLALALGDELGVDLQLAEPSGGDPGSLKERTCFLPWHETWVDIDGSILVCHSHGGTVAGTLADFTGAWNGPLHQRLRAGFARGTPVGACRGCGMNIHKPAEHVPVPFDPASFLSGRDLAPGVRWSGRMRQFDLAGWREVP